MFIGLRNEWVWSGRLSAGCSGKAGAKYGPALGEASLGVREKEEEGKEENSPWSGSCCTGWEWAKPLRSLSWGGGSQI